MANKRPSVKLLKKRLDTLFSAWYRRSNARRGYLQCYTCKKTLHWKEMQTGHFISRAKNSLRYSTDNVRPQCYRCNCVLNGNLIEYMLNLTDEIGEMKVRELYERSKQLKQFKVPELQELIEEYKSKLKELYE